MKFKEFLRKYAFRIIVFVIMVGFLVYFFYGLDFQGSYEVLKSASIGYLLLALLFMIISAAVKAYRFYILLKPNHPELKFLKFLLPYLVGYGFSVLGPFKTGEVASVEINKRNLNVSRSSSFAALAFFRVVDVVVVLVFFIMALGVTVPSIISNTADPDLASNIQLATNIVFYLAIAGTVVLTAILFVPHIGRFFLKITAAIIRKISNKAGDWLDRVIKPALEEYYKSLKFLYSKILISFVVITTTVARWILEFYSLKFTLIAFGSDISLIDAASVISIALLIGLITFVPAGIGTGTITTQVLLIGLLIDKNIADASILYQALIGIILTLLLAAIASPFLKDKQTESLEEKTDDMIEEEKDVESAS
ncbi:flippase-like domain-containing protein [Candidatus Heimdallarchaeota archaeon]|nr:MAG: flippase-like domain-containing protein [Candidatus Heimdallarchaeota archaeon]